MALLDIQRRGRELGRIRLGQQVVGKNGKKRPEKLSTFRFTTNSRAGADAIAGLLGGDVHAWEGGTQQWEVVTPVNELPVVVPPGDGVIDQHYELWSGGGCQRRCDSQTAHTRNDQGDDVTGPCQCPADGKERADLAAIGKACKPTTRLNVMLPDLPDIGVWRVESHGFYAAVELGGAAELLVSARDGGVFLPATLRLEKRRSAVPGRPVREWYVPVLEIGATVRELTSGEAGGGLQKALPPAPTKAITAGTPSPAAAAAPPVAAAAAAPSQSAQDYADVAATAEWAEDVVELGTEANAEGLLGEQVTVAGHTGSLGDYLLHRAKQLQARPSQPDEDGAVDAELVEDGPTLETAQAAAAGWS